MVADLGVGSTYHLLVTLFQFGLALLIYSAGRLDDVRVGVATITLLSGGETLLLALWELGVIRLWGHPIYHSLFEAFDIGIVILLAVLLSRLPNPLFPQSSRRTRRFVLVAAVTVLPLVHFLARAAPGLGLDRNWTYYVLHTLPFVLAAMFLLFHFVPGWLDLAPGPYRTMTMLAGAGLAMSPVYQGVRWLTAVSFRLRDQPFADHALPRQVAIAFLVTMGLLSLAAIAWVAARWLRTRDPTTGVLTLLLLVPVALGVRAPFVDVSILGEFASQAVRPVIFAVAILRYDLFQVPRGLRRVAVPLTLVLSSTVVFLLLGILLSPEGVRTKAFSPSAATLSALGVAGLAVVLQEPLSGMVRSARKRESTSGERLQRYRLALESLRARTQGPSTGEVESLRMRFGVSWDEHEALESIMERNLLVPTSAVHGLQPGDLVADRYEVVRVLGEGGFGRAVLARDRRWGDRVVVKGVRHPWSDEADTRRASLLREARAGVRVDDPHLARVIEVVEEGGSTYLVREYVPGETLDQVVASEGPLGEERAVAVVDDVLHALEALHDEGLAHLDLKPGNVVLRSDGTAVLIDLGSAAGADPVAGDGADGDNTQPLTEREAAGSLAWTAPEQLRGEPVGPPADVFAAGALLHYLLTGRRHVAVAGRVRFQVEDDVVRGDPPRLHGRVSDPVADVVERALQRDPAARFPDATALRGALPER